MFLFLEFVNFSTILLHQFTNFSVGNIGLMELLSGFTFIHISICEITKWSPHLKEID